MSLGLALSNAISGMELNQQSLSVLSQNIANVNTPGYSRQVLNQESIHVEGVGNGVRAKEIVRKIDVYLQRSQQTQSSVVGNTSVISNYYDQLQTVLGSPGANNSVDSYLTTFFNGAQQLASSPDSVSNRSNFVNASVTLTQQISSLAKRIEELRFQADGDMAANINTVNASLDKLYSLNGALNRAAGLKQSTAGLFDARDKELQTLSENMDIAVSFGSTGAVTISTGNGISLIDDVVHHLQYSAAASAESFYAENPLNPMTVVSLDATGKVISQAQTLMTGGTSAEVENRITGGNFAALQQLRDVIMPGILGQLDQLASRVRDSVNALNNQGSGFPAPSELSGERLVMGSDVSDWTGTLRIAALTADGQPVSANYTNESSTGLRPLTLDLSTLDSGSGLGKPSVQTIIDEINEHFGAPQTKTSLGLVNNLQLVSDTNVLPSGSPPLLNFDFNAENISGSAAKVFITGMTVKDDTGNDITNVMQGPPTVALNSSGTYQTIAGSADVSIALQSAVGLSSGQSIYLGSPGSAVVTSGVDGIAASALTGYFTIKSIVGNTITVTNSAGTLASTGTTVADASPASAISSYDTINSGENRRTRDTGGQLQVDFSGGVNSGYYDITVNVGVMDPTGNVKSSAITYRVANGVHDQLNARFGSIAATGSGQRVTPKTTQATLQAMLVDADGNEVQKFNGKYLNEAGYLKIVATDPNVSIVVDQMNSTQLGNPTGIPAVPASNQGFSHYFGLNNFFASNNPNATGDTAAGSALNFRVEQRILDNPNLISTGSLVLQNQPTDPKVAPQYTYVRHVGDNSIAQKMAALSSAVTSFDAAGGLPATQVSLQGYAGNLLADISSKSAAATDTNTNAKALLDGLNARASSISGVNLDDELANTVTFQNAYAATARIISVVDKMFESLLSVA